MAVQILKCRSKTVTNKGNENSVDITDKSSTILTPIELGTLLNTRLRSAHTRAHLAGP